ncbi:hypothetical protein FTX61_16090 [Nitriliruptoraceae bacterium ZYF776]|nr:hypothetical protein [Profundirhabdus halotolerans]
MRPQPSAHGTSARSAEEHARRGGRDPPWGGPRRRAGGADEALRGRGARTAGRPGSPVGRSTQARRRRGRGPPGPRSTHGGEAGIPRGDPGRPSD